MFIKTVFLSIIVIFLLQLIYNFINERFLTKIPANDTKFSEVEKYKKIAEEATAAISSIKQTTPPPLQSNDIETIFNIENELKDNSSPDDMETCLLNLVKNG